MKLSVIASGSKGNSYILEERGTHLLLECGEPLRKVMKRLHYNLSGVTACLLTHEHQDHAKYIAEYIASFIPIYTSRGTKEAVIEKHELTPLESKLIYTLEEKQSKVGLWRVIPFPTQHDANEPLGFVVVAPSGENLLFATDTFYIRPRFKGLKHLLIECNYIDEIAQENYDRGRIAYNYLQRLERSHMSLGNCLAFLKANDLSEVRTIILCHLSDANSDAKAMREAVQRQTGIPTYIATSGAEIPLTPTPF